MPTVITTRAIEESTFVVSVSFFDEGGDAVVPNSATWSLLDLDGNIINNRDGVTIIPLASTVSIVLSGDDLAINPLDQQNQWRRLLVDAVYDSDLGLGLPLADELQFKVSNLVGKPEA